MFIRNYVKMSFTGSLWTNAKVRTKISFHKLSSDFVVTSGLHHPRSMLVFEQFLTHGTAGTSVTWIVVCECLSESADNVYHSHQQHDTDENVLPHRERGELLNRGIRWIFCEKVTDYGFCFVFVEPGSEFVVSFLFDVFAHVAPYFMQNIDEHG